MSRRYVISLSSSLVLSVLLAPAQSADRDDSIALLKSLKAEHPRLLFTKEMERSVRDAAESDQLLQRLVKQNTVNAEAMLSSSPIRYEIPDGKRLLAQSRKCIERVTTLAIAYRWTDDKRFAEAAVGEMLIATRFKDWNPSHFLDTAEMTTALAIGYDWLYDVISSDDGKSIREAIVRLGLNEGLKIYTNSGWWTTGNNNWNEVCNSGMLMGALAIAEDEAELAARIIHFARKSIPRGLSVYPPDGAYPEGPTYWQYGTTYTCLTIKALSTALDNDLGISKSPGLEVTGDYRMHTLGPNNLYFNYADAGSNSRPAAAMWILAQKYDNTSYSHWHVGRLQSIFTASLDDIKARRLDRFFPLEIAFYQRPKDDDAQTPLDALFRGRQDVVTMRSAWNDEDAVYVGAKGGDNQTNHGHLDIGSFVLDAGGVRWATDLGSDNYNLRGYFGRQRWSYYRLNNRSHNTLVVDDKLQNSKAVCRIVAFSSKEDRATAIVDMTDAYAGQVESARRGIELVNRRAIHVRDELSGVLGEVRWGMVTPATITLRGAKAILKQRDKTLVVELLSPPGAEFEVVSTDPPTTTERSNRGTRMLAVRVHAERDDRVAISVVMQLEGDPSVTTDTFSQSLSSWPRGRTTDKSR